MRRAMFSMMAAVMLVIVGMVGATNVHADPGTIWCWDDPVLSINGQVVSINVGVQGTPDQVRRTVQVARTTVFVPRGVNVKVLAVTNTYFEEEVKIQYTNETWRPGTPVKVAAVVTFNTRGNQVLPAAANAVFGGNEIDVAYGNTQSRLALDFTLPATR